MNHFKLQLAILFSILSVSLFAQENFLQNIQKALVNTEELTQSDVSGIEITNNFVSKHNGVRHIYGTQIVNGIPIANSNFSAAFDKNGVLVNVAHRFFKGVHSKSSQTQASINEATAIYNAAGSEINGLSVVPQNGKFMLNSGNGYFHSTDCDLVYYMNPEAELILVWSFNVDMPAKDHWWNYYVDANTGNVVHKIDWQVSCTYGESHDHSNSCSSNIPESGMLLPPPPTDDGSSYRVFEFPVESPNHGERTLATEPALLEASPFGWHDEDGLVGPDFAITRGNNVYVYEDENDFNSPGYSPDGGSNLLFDFPYVPEDGPGAYQDASLTNLFYTNNRIHDLLYIYGFDEESGNFQSRNYSGLGEGFDAVNAEGQDGGGTNNANMATPPEGNAPRMQMYLWSGEPEVEDLLFINDPGSISGAYTTSDVSAFGALIPDEGITADVVLGEDGEGGDENDLCEPATNGADLTGKIVLAKRGNCNFADKVINAMDAGAVACIIINNGPGFINMGGTSPVDITIPSIMISQADGQTLLDELSNGETVNATLMGGGLTDIRDGSFDNGIVTHEYVHGVSNRLTGGANSSGCLGNEEQMGEGWSDWYATMLTMNMDAENPVYRPMGTFAIGENTDGVGIRPVPYDTSFAVNDYTYANLGNGNISVPHGVGFIWATMLWDLSWAFMDEYGYEDIETSTTGGNNIVMQLVTDGLKLQPCGPGFVDGRDAILLADELNNDGANQCLIWRVFAKRGLGYSADQGSADNRDDGIAAFDIPTSCQIALVAPNAAFEATPVVTCQGYVEFTDLSTDIPQEWSWDFGDGNGSDEQNPIHQYDETGEYTVSLTVTNTIGEDTSILIDLIQYSLLNNPLVDDAVGCIGETITYSAITEEGEVVWLDEDENILQVGNEFEQVLQTDNPALYVQSIDMASDFVGPVTGDFGGGVIHGSAFVGTVDFEAHTPLTIVSAWVNSGGPGIRVVSLWDEAGGLGTLIAEIPVVIDFTGTDRVDLGFEILVPGVYSIGLNEANLYRNDAGVNYPYVGSEGLLDIVGSSAGSEYYYYFYDLEITATLCASDLVQVIASVLVDADFSFETNELSTQFTDLSGSTSGWSWDFGDGNFSDEQNPVHVYDEEGVYTVTFSTDQGCSFSLEVEVIVSGIAEASSGGIVTMPNPANSELRIVNSSGKHNLVFAKLVDLQGRVVIYERIDFNNDHVMNVSNLSNGFYLLILEDLDAQPKFQQKISIVH